MPQFQNGDLFLRSIGSGQLIPQPSPLLRTEGRFQGGQVEGHRIGYPSAPAVRDIGHHPVLVVPPPGEPGKPVKDLFVIGVEDMGAVLVDQHPRLVRTVIGIAANVVPPLQHQDPFPLIRQSAGGHGAGIARSHGQNVKFLLQARSHLVFRPAGRYRCSFVSYHTFPEKEIKIP